MIELVMTDSAIGDDGESTDGERTVIATMEGDQISGRLAKQIKEMLGTAMRYGATGEEFRVSIAEPWTIAYALSISNAPFMEVNMQKVGPVVAVKDGRELAVPARYTGTDDTSGVIF